MSTDTTIARALEFYSNTIGVPVHSLALRRRLPGDRPVLEEYYALRVCEREDALRAFLAGRQHFDSSDRLLIEWVLARAQRDAHSEFGQYVVPEKLLR